MAPIDALAVSHTPGTIRYGRGGPGRPPVVEAPRGMVACLCPSIPRRPRWRARGDREGATIVNDVAACSKKNWRRRSLARAAIVLMHNRGRSREMYREAAYDDVVGEIGRELEAAIGRATAAGIPRELVIVDPGFGFAKRAEHTWESLAELDRLAALDRPILVGPSRKSFLTTAVAPGSGDWPPSERDWATAAAVTASVLGGAHIVRVHAVREMADVVRVSDRLRAAAIRH